MAVTGRETTDEMECPWCERQIPVETDICPHCETMLH